MKAPQSIDEAMYMVACLSLDIEAAAQHAHRRARALRREGTSEALTHAGWHVRFEAQAQTVLRELRKLTSLGLSGYLGDVYADRDFDGEDDGTSAIPMFAVKAVNDALHLGKPVDALHGDSPDSRRSA